MVYVFHNEMKCKKNMDVKTILQLQQWLSQSANNSVNFTLHEAVNTGSYKVMKAVG